MYSSSWPICNSSFFIKHRFSPDICYLLFACRRWKWQGASDEKRCHHSPLPQGRASHDAVLSSECATNSLCMSHERCIWFTDYVNELEVTSPLVCSLFGNCHEPRICFTDYARSCDMRHELRLWVGGSLGSRYEAVFSSECVTNGVWESWTKQMSWR